MAIRTVITLAPDSETTAMAKRMLGIAISPSIVRIMTASIHLKKPETRPITNPIPMLKTAAPRPIRREIRPPLENSRQHIAAVSVGAEQELRARGP